MSASSAAPPTPFVLPPIYSFPPLFTLQPTDATRAKQLESWRWLILGWCAAHRVSSIHLREWPLWENAAISRRLSEEGIAAVAEHLIGVGCAVYADGSRTRLTVYYRSPGEWAACVFSWVEAHAMFDQLYTVFELGSGDATVGSDFAGLEPGVLVKALEVLEREGKAVLERSASADEVGVKFVAARGR